jgi:hypothetical protein
MLLSGFIRFVVFFLKKQRNREVVGERWHVQQAEQKKNKGP